MGKLGAGFGSNMEGIRELLRQLFTDNAIVTALTRQVAFLFDFEKVEHTTVLGLALQDIMKDSKHLLRPWELLRHRNIIGMRRAKAKSTASTKSCLIIRRGR